MENSLTFHTARYCPSGRYAVACQFFGTDGRVRRNAVRIGKGGQQKAKDDLRAWAMEHGWNG